MRIILKQTIFIRKQKRERESLKILIHKIELLRQP